MKRYIILFLALVNRKCEGYTNEEIKATEQLRNEMGSELYQPYMQDDFYLVEWLRDKKLNVAEAKEKLTKSLRWRKENNIDALTTHPTSELDEVAKVAPWDFMGHDVNGRPVITQEYSKWNIRKLALAGKQKEASRYFTKVFESAAAKVRKIHTVNSNVTQWIAMGDFNGYNLRQHGCLSCLPILVNFVRIYEANYPGQIKHMITINSPSIVGALLSLVKLAMSEQSRKTFLVYGTNKEEWKFLDSIISRKELPSRFGGTKTKFLEAKFP